MTPTVPSEEAQAIVFYAGVMEEIKTRFQAIETLLNGKTGLPSAIAFESYHLQLRMICELVALGCLLAHGDIEATRTKTFVREYSAQKIMDAMTQLHPDFFPRHTTIAKTAYGWHGFLPKEGNFISKAEFITLYGRSGDYLHRGSLKKILSTRQPPPVSIEELALPAQRIANLLSTHSIARLSGNPWICILTDSAKGKAKVFTLSPTPWPEGANPPAGRPQTE